MDNVCIKCGGTGITFEGKECDCGSQQVEIEEMSDIDKYIPLLYQDIDKGIGFNQVIEDLVAISLQEVLDKIVRNKNSQSLIIDLSGTTEGAYNVYYYILGKLIEDNNGELPKDVNDYIMVNNISLEQLNSIENKVSKGIWKPLYIITDYKLSKYEGINNVLKILKFNKFQEKSYPLNVYHMKFRER